MTYIPPQKIEKSAFGETTVVNDIAFIEGSSSYDLIPANFREFTATGGSTTATGRLFQVSTGTSVGGYGAIQSFRSIPHRVGKGVMGRFSGYFATSAADSWQGIGFISIGEEMSFGYNGTDFGIWHRYGGLPEVRTITVTGAAGAATDLTLTLNSVAYTIPLTTGTVQHNAYEIEAWLNDTANQTVWKADQIDDTVIISAQSDGAKSGTYTFSHATATGTIAQNTAGVTKTSDHVAQADWNGTAVFSGFDPANGNLYQVGYQNMGYGEVVYSIMNPNTGEYDVVHREKIPNEGTTLGVPNPSMRTGFYCVSIGSTTNLDVYANSLSAFVEGTTTRTRNPRAYSASQSITTTTETAILTIRNRRTYNFYNNQIQVLPLVVGVSNETTRSAVVRVRAVSDVGIEQNFQEIGNNLVIDVDNTAVNFTGGRLLAAKPIAAGGFTEIDLEKLQVNMPPSLKILITVERTATGGSNTNFEGTVTWYEDL